MATVISGSSGQRVYPVVIQQVLKNGVPRVARGLRTLDLGYTVIELASPHQALALGCGRNLSRNIAAAEAIQLIGGFTYPDLLLKASPQMARYMDGDRFHGSYGQRIGYQMLHIARKLRADAGTRQAVVTLWDPMLDNQEGKKDYPCTVALQFDVHDGILNMNTIMRSNDAWLGLPYDIFQFTQLMLTLATVLDVSPGTYRHTALSLHLYEQDVSAAYAVRDPVDFLAQPGGVGKLGMSMSDVMKRARSLTVADFVNVDGETDSERWYRDRFASYMG